MLPHVLSHLLLQEPREEGAMIATFQMRTLRPREMQEPARSYTVRKMQAGSEGVRVFPGVRARELVSTFSASHLSPSPSPPLSFSAINTRTPAPGKGRISSLYLR